MAAVNRASSNSCGSTNGSGSASGSANGSGSGSGSNMPKRYIGILFFCCFLVIWRTVTDEAGAAASTASATLTATATSTSTSASSSSSSLAVAAAAAAAAAQMQLQLVPQLQPSANGSKPNQIHEPSRTQQQQISSNLSSYSNYSPSLVSLDNAATPAPTPTAANRIRSISVSASPAASASIFSLSPAMQMSADASQLIDLHDFGYLMEQPACESYILALILVHTAPRNEEKRALIRQTWGGPGMTAAPSPLRLVFLLGAVPATEPDLQYSLERENLRHGDMVQGNFQDAYRNMTYKHVMALKWFNSHCPHAQLLIKVDDDVYVNTPELHKLLRPDPQPSPAQLSHTSTNRSLSQSPLRALLQQPRELLFCKPVLESRVKRSYRSKWRVSFREYPAHYYPPYCPGFAIIYSTDVVQRLYQAAQQSDYFWVDDVHITGVLAQRTNTTITTLQPYVLYERDCERLLNGASALAEQEFLFTWHSISPEQVSSLWQLHVAQNYTNLEERETNMSDVELEAGLS